MSFVSALLLCLCDASFVAILKTFASYTNFEDCFSRRKRLSRFFENVLLDKTTPN